MKTLSNLNIARKKVSEGMKAYFFSNNEEAYLLKIAYNLKELSTTETQEFLASGYVVGGDVASAKKEALRRAESLEKEMAQAVKDFLAEMKHLKKSLS